MVLWQHVVLCKSTLLEMCLAMVWVVCYVVRDFHYVTHDPHHSQTHPQQRSLTQHDMLPQHPVNIMELFCECFLNDFSKEQRSSLRMISESKHVGAILSFLM